MPALEHGTNFVGDAQGELAQCAVEIYIGAALLFAVKKAALLDAACFAPEAGFEADGLAAELNFIGTVGFGAAAFVFDREESAVGVDFDDVANTTQPVGVRPDREPTGYADAGARFAEAGVRLFVERVAFGGGKVIRPQPLDVDKCALPRAVEVVLERGERDCMWVGDLRFWI